MRHDYHKLAKHNGRVRLHLHTGFHIWDQGYKHNDVAHNLTRGQAFRLGLRLIFKAGSRL